MINSVRTCSLVLLLSASCAQSPAETPSPAPVAPVAPAAPAPVEAPMALPPGHPPITGDSPHGSAAPGAPAAAVQVARLPGGLTLAELFADRTALAGKPVALRARVVKANGGILNMNWIHVQDGTGSAGTDDILVTTPPTTALPTVGSVVEVRGTLALDRDFGGGYAYATLIQDATFAASASP